VIVGNDRKLISGDVISTPDDKISEIAAGNVTLSAEVLVGKRDCFPIRGAKAPIHTFRFLESPPIIS
jgi:hypothetical protein